jgi:hypothetical protein
VGDDHWQEARERVRSRQIRRIYPWLHLLRAPSSSSSSTSFGGNRFVREFNPETIDDVKAVLASEHNPKIRMVVGYWDMAASLVTHGAVDRQMFLDANGEIFATFSKIHPLLSQIREMAPIPGFAKHLEQVVMSVPDVEPRLEALRQRFRPQPQVQTQRGEGHG